MSGKKRKTTTTVEEIVPTDGTIEEDSPPEMNFNLEDVREAEQLEEIASQFPNAGITLKLYDENGAYCITIPDPKSIDEELIRKRCGAGNFRLRIYINGKYRHYIPLPIREVQPDSSVTTPPNSARNGDSSNSHSDFLEKQAQRNHELLLAAISSTRSAGPSITDLTTALANIDSLRGKQESGVDLIMKGIDLAQRFSGDTDWKTDLIRMGKDVLPKIADGVTAVMGVRNNGHSQQIQPTVTNNEGEAQTQELPSAEAIRAGIAYLKRKCLNGVDPDLIIDWIVPNADEYQGLIRVILNKDFSEFAQYDIEIGSEPYLGWFRKLFDGLRSAFSPTDSMDDTSGGLVGDTDHTGDHGQSGTNGKSQPKGPKASA